MSRKPSTAKVKIRPESAKSSAAELTALEQLAMELYSVVCKGLTLYGLPVARQKLLFRRTLKEVPVHAVSGPLLEQFCSLSDLLTTWLEELPYTDGIGRPRILPIKGKGATFESLARQFLPEKSLEEVVALACKTAGVGQLEGGRIAIYGDPLVKPVHNPEAALAHTILHIRRIISTSQLNVKMRNDPSKGNYERFVSYALDRKQWDIFKTVFRPQLDDMCQRADRLLKAHALKSRGPKRRTQAGLAAYLYNDGDDILDPLPSAPKKTRASRKSG